MLDDKPLLNQSIETHYELLQYVVDTVRSERRRPYIVTKHQTDWISVCI